MDSSSSETPDLLLLVISAGMKSILEERFIQFSPRMGCILSLPPASIIPSNVSSSTSLPSSSSLFILVCILFPVVDRIADVLRTVHGCR